MSHCSGTTIGNSYINPASSRLLSAGSSSGRRHISPPRTSVSPRRGQRMSRHICARSAESGASRAGSSVRSSDAIRILFEQVGVDWIGRIDWDHWRDSARRRGHARRRGLAIQGRKWGRTTVSVPFVCFTTEQKYVVRPRLPFLISILGQSCEARIGDPRPGTTPIAIPG